MSKFIKTLVLGSFFAGLLVAASASAQVHTVKTVRHVDNGVVVKNVKHVRHHNNGVVIVKKNPGVRYYSREGYRYYGGDRHHKRYYRTNRHYDNNRSYIRVYDRRW